MKEEETSRIIQTRDHARLRSGIRQPREKIPNTVRAKESTVQYCVLSLLGEPKVNSPLFFWQVQLVYRPPLWEIHLSSLCPSHLKEVPGEEGEEGREGRKLLDSLALASQNIAERSGH